MATEMLLANGDTFRFVSNVFSWNNMKLSLFDNLLIVLMFLFQNPDIVLVHYLNVPYPDDNKLAVITPSLALWGDKKEWTKEELVSQLKPMCLYFFILILESILIHLNLKYLCIDFLFSVFSEDEPDVNNELEISVSIQINKKYLY